MGQPDWTVMCNPPRHSGRGDPKAKAPTGSSKSRWARVKRVHYKRVIPCMDVDNGRVVKGTKFIDIRDAGDPVELAAHYDAQGADELIFLDITATSDKRATVVELARRAADDVFVPFTIGGGVRRWRTPTRSSTRAPTRSASTRPRSSPAADRRAREGLRRAVRRARDRRQEAPRRHLRGLRRRRAHPHRQGRHRLGAKKASSAERGRSCSPAWTATAPRTATSSR